jgi:hypothetical protein
VDFPVLGFPTTPSNREYDPAMIVHLVYVGLMFCA